MEVSFFIKYNIKVYSPSGLLTTNINITSQCLVELLYFNIGVILIVTVIIKKIIEK